MDLEFKSLDEYGHYINTKYPNVRFVFEIHYTRDEYKFLTEHFFDETDFSQTQFSSEYFHAYFNNHPSHRLLFLMLLTGFIRYEYLNDENGANFFSNFLKNCLYNEFANIQTFRGNLINYFFKFMGDRQFELQGLYLYSTQTDEVSLKLEEAGHHQFLNTFILHAGGISDKDLHTYTKIIKSISENNEIMSFSNRELYDLIKTFKNHNNRLKNFFGFLISKNEVADFVRHIIAKSIDCYHNSCRSIYLNSEFSFDLPLFIKNFLLFTGKYGQALERYKINASNIYYENQNLFFTPKYNHVFSHMKDIYFQINGKKFTINKSRDLFVSDDFLNCKILLENPEQIQQIDLYIDEHLYKRYELNLFKVDFILLNSTYELKHIYGDTIEVAMGDEDSYLYILSREILDYELEDELLINHRDFYLYKIKTDRTLSNLNIGNRIYTIHYQPKFTAEYDYKNDDGYEYFGVVPEFSALSEVDTNSFIAVDLLNNIELTYQEYLAYSDVIGKFDISIGIHNFKVIYIDGFSIEEWFRWHDSEKTVEISVTTNKIKTNSTEEVIDDTKIIHIFDLDIEKKNLVFNTIEGKQVTLPILKPSMKFTFIDKRKQKYIIKSKNIYLATLSNYRKLTIELLNFPNAVKFTKLDINGQTININKIENKYYISLNELKEICSENPASHYPLKLVGNGNYYLDTLNILDPEIDPGLTKFGVRDIVKIRSVDFIHDTMGEMKYYIFTDGKFKPYFATKIEYDSYYNLEMVTFIEARDTKNENKNIRSSKMISQDGIYVDRKDLDCQENIV